MDFKLRITCNAVTDAYLRESGVRGRKWNQIPPRQATAVPTVAHAIITNEADAKGWMAATFEALSPDWCQATFRSPLPPLNFFGTTGARRRYFSGLEWEKRSQPAESTKADKLCRRAARSLSLWLSSEDDMTLLALWAANGSMDSSFAPYLVERGKTEDLVRLTKVVGSKDVSNSLIAWDPVSLRDRSMILKTLDRVWLLDG